MEQLPMSRASFALDIALAIQMTPKSIRSHLAPYSIFSKRKTTVAHAFASALAPSDEYDEKKIEAALNALGQKDLKQLSCVYCENQAQTWDHLENLVKAGKLNGYGHQIGNLVPCCRDCNSQKGGKPFRAFIVANAKLTETEKSNLTHRLETHLALAKPIQPSNLSLECQEALTKFLALQTQILGLMEEADKYAQVLRSQRNG
ncbi:MAG: HNH endonuclease [Gammaproteobacteria bacterium]|nr:HNH endonuclease [Gammaproteobacteria bacterium]MBU4081612.1 HNH endonuclease [Gammaproteobacteria bacterium]